MNQTIVNEQRAVTMSFATIREDVNASGPGSRCLQVQIYEQTVDGNKSTGSDVACLRCLKIASRE